MSCELTNCRRIILSQKIVFKTSAMVTATTCSDWDSAADAAVMLWCTADMQEDAIKEDSDDEGPHNPDERISSM